MADPFADNVRRLIREQWLTQAGLAQMIGVTQPAVACYLKQNNPQLTTLRKIKSALSCSWEELLDEE